MDNKRFIVSSMPTNDKGKVTNPSLWNRKLSETFFRLALLLTMAVGKTNRIVNPYFYHYYRKKLSDGKTKKQALKCCQRRLVNILWGMMKNNTEYINPPTYDEPPEPKKGDTA